MLKIVTITGAALLLGGCAPLVAAGVGGAAALTAPAVSGVITTVTTGVAVLSDAAKLACATQAFANAIGNAKLGAEAGMLCKW